MAAVNELKHLDDFRKVLKDFHLSDSAKQTLDQTKVVLLVAPTAAGRNTIINELLKGDGYHYIVSDTTRHPRVNNGIPEQDGREYWFRDEESVLQDLRNGEFLEAAVIHNQQVSGISIRELEKAHQAKQIAITDIEIAGAAHIHNHKPDAIVLFIVPPALDTWLARIHGRGDMPAEELKRRLESACKEFATALASDYYTFVLNNDFHEAVTEIHELVVLNRHDPHRDEQARRVAEQLYRDTQVYLKGL